MENGFSTTSFFYRNSKWKSLIVGIIFVFVNLVIANNTRKDGLRFVMWSDGLGYYCYLPSAFIIQDLDRFVYGIDCPATGKKVNKYTAGVAILESPFFFVAHLVALNTTPQPDFMSETYEFCITLGTITYVFLALLMLYQILQRYVKKKIALFTVMILYLTTNLYYYTVGESGMSHAYSFFTMTWFLWGLFHFLEKPNWKNSIQIGIALGLSVLIRPTNVFIVILPFLLHIKDFKEFKTRFKNLISQPYTYLSLAFAFLAVLPQLIYWKLQSGSFIYFSYQGESFSFLKSPHIGEVLFGNVAGLFTYSPMLLFFIPGLFVLIKRNQRYTAMAILLAFSIITYLNASWWVPTFDCSFGHRAFIEYYPLLSIPIALFLEAFFIRWKAYVITFAFILFAYINIRMTYLYKKHPCWKSDYGISWSWNNVKYVYRVVFFVDKRPSEHFRIIESNRK